jgi:hypothetical protein
MTIKHPELLDGFTRDLLRAFTPSGEPTARKRTRKKHPAAKTKTREHAARTTRYEPYARNPSSATLSARAAHAAARQHG